MKQSDTARLQTVAGIYAACRDELVHFATARLGSREDGEDAVHDAFVKMLEYDDIITPATARSFAFTITANKVTDRLRRRAFRHGVERDAPYLAETGCDTVTRTVEYHETLRRVERGIGALPPARARIYRMSLYGGMAAGDIAGELRISKRTVEAQLFSSRKMMRELLRREA